VWNDLVAAGLVDELFLMLGAAVLGGGASIFGTGASPHLRLLDIRRWEGSDKLLLRCEVLRPAS